MPQLGKAATADQVNDSSHPFCRLRVRPSASNTDKELEGITSQRSVTEVGGRLRAALAVGGDCGVKWDQRPLIPSEDTSLGCPVPLLYWVSSL